MPNWAEQVTAIATAIGCIGLLSAVGAAIFAGRQVQEARIGRQAEIAAEFFRRWSEPDLVETRRLVSRYPTKEALRDAFVRAVDANNTDAWVMYRELDYFEQLAALEEHGGFSFEMIRGMLGPRLVQRYELWRPAIEAIGGPQTYPNFCRLARKMQKALAAA